MGEENIKPPKLHEALPIVKPCRPCGKLALALSKAQGKIMNAHKDSNNPFFKSSYADLASVWDACREALSENEIAVLQKVMDSSGDKMVRVSTKLVHSSGEWDECVVPIPLTKVDAHGIGSAITYARRYGLSSMVGVTPSDDDGNAATEGGNAKK